MAEIDSGALAVGLIGAGVMGRLRARALRRCSGLVLRAVADADEAALRATLVTGEVKRLRDYQSLLERSDLDAVIISTPTHLHEEMILCALAAGKHVLCEKPLSNTVASCRAIVEAAARAGRMLAVGFNHRYFRSVQYLKWAVKRGSIGELYHLRMYGGHEGLGQFRGEWMYRSEQSGGGAMMDIGIHLTDLARHIAAKSSRSTGPRAIASGTSGGLDNALAIQIEVGRNDRYQASGRNGRATGS